MSDPMLQVARQAVRAALRLGARAAAATAACSREVKVDWRDGKLDRTFEATTRGVALQLFVDGRYCAVSTSDLRDEAMERFVGDSVRLARALAPDPDRVLPEAALCAGQAAVDLQVADPDYESLSGPRRLEALKAMEEAARSAPGAEAILSVTAVASDVRTESARVHSTGFEGTRLSTLYSWSVQTSVRDPDGRRPQEDDSASARFLSDLPAPTSLGRSSAERALRRRGAQKPPTGVMAVVVQNRAAPRLVAHLLSPLTAAALQQRRSLFEGRVGERVGSEHLDVADDPLVPRGLGSQRFDGEGLAARRFPLFERGVLRGFYVDTYYGRKLKLRPTTAATSNLAWRCGERGPGELLMGVKEGLWVTGFLGGNSNGTTGDFSLGVQGFLVRQGAPAEPVAQATIASNHLQLWKDLAAVGNDPYLSSSLRTPTLVFEGVQVAGT